MSIEAMKLALEALENTYAYLPRRWGGEREADQAITALRQALAEAEKQEPVAWRYEGEHGYQYTDDIKIAEFYSQTKWAGLTDGELADLLTEKPQPLYTAPVHASDISQERVDETAKRGHEFECPRCGHCCPEREWVGFTHEELAWLNEALNLGGRLAVIEAIEKALKEKNT